jgi:hypothetical protein
MSRRALRWIASGNSIRIRQFKSPRWNDCIYLAAIDSFNSYDSVN